MKHKETDFNEILNSALAEYRDAQPLAGIEDRVLHRLHSCSPRTNHLVWRLVTVAAAAALTVVVCIGERTYVEHLHPSTRVQQQASMAVPEIKSAPETAPSSSRRMQPGVKRVPSVSSHGGGDLANGATPHREQFPTPVPLTSSERALLALAQHHPAVLQTLATNNIEKPIAIAPIKITPLQTTGDPEGDE